MGWRFLFPLRPSDSGQPAKALFGFASALFLAAQLACSGGGGTSAPPPQTVSIIVTPSASTVSAGSPVSLTAAVTGSSNTAVDWTILNGGGSLTVGAPGAATAVFNAPAVTSVSTASVRATSQADSTKSATAVITINPVVGISISGAPTSPIVALASVPLTATVTGTTNTGVNWVASGGSIAAAPADTRNATYTAPSAAGTYTVTATSVADSSKSATATLTVTAGPEVAISISGTPASPVAPIATVPLTATVTGTTNTGVTWLASGGTILANPTDTRNATYTAPVAAGTYTVTAASVADPTKTAAAQITVVVAPVDFDDPTLTAQKANIQTIARASSLIMVGTIQTVGAPPGAWSGFFIFRQTVTYTVSASIPLAKGSYPNAALSVSHIVVATSRQARSDGPVGLNTTLFAPGTQVILLLKAPTGTSTTDVSENFSVIPYSSQNYSAVIALL